MSIEETFARMKAEMESVDHPIGMSLINGLKLKHAAAFDVFKAGKRLGSFTEISYAHRVDPTSLERTAKADADYGYTRFYTIGFIPPAATWNNNSEIVTARVIDSLKVEKIHDTLWHITIPS